MSLKENLDHTKKHLDRLERKYKRYQTHKVTIQYCETMIPFLKGRVSAFKDVEKKMKR